MSAGVCRGVRFQELEFEAVMNQPPNTVLGSVTLQGCYMLLTAVLHSSPH